MSNLQIGAYAVGKLFSKRKIPKVGCCNTFFTNKKALIWAGQNSENWSTEIPYYKFHTQYH